MKKFMLAFFIGLLTFSAIQSQDEAERSAKKTILAIMAKQQVDWSDGDLEGFMEGYWKSDSLKFYSSRGITYGWENTLENYKKGYPDQAHTGTLKFRINDISKIGEAAYYVMGEYYLNREIGDANGVFMIIFRKIDGVWKIIADMSC